MKIRTTLPMEKLNKPIRLLLLTSAFFVGSQNGLFAENEYRPEDKSGALSIKPQSDPNGPVPLAAEVSDIPSDPAVTWGVLDSGMRYAILPNPEPPGRLSLRLYVDAGSLMETDAQQGIAHFLEHMAFNGTENFVPGEMVKYFQRLGMGFGVHTNAHTNFAETVYKLELPNLEEKTLGDSFTLLRDFADGMKFPEAEIERERGVILSEKRSADSADARTSEALLKFALPEHRISSRLPIGINEVITGAKRERFVDFYNTWYTPNRMVLIAVGDTTVEAIKAQIDKHFGDLKARPKAPMPDLGKMSNRGFSTHYHYEKESGATTLSFEKLKPATPLPVSQERNGGEIRRIIATIVVNKRLEQITKQESSPITAGSMVENDILDVSVESAITAACKPQNWEAALKVIEQELRRALEFGFTSSELSETKAQLLNYFQMCAEQANTRISSELANQISRAIGKREVFSHPRTDFEWAQKELNLITGEECLASIREAWSGEGEMMLIMSGNAKVEGAEAQLASVFQESSQVAVTPPQEKAPVVFAYTDLPEAGQILEQKEIKDLGVTQIRFENNVRVNLKVTDFEDGAIYVKARIGSGILTEPKDKPGLGTFLNGSFLSGGLEAHDSEEIERFVAGKMVGFGFSVDDGAFVLSGGTNSRDLHKQLLLMRAYLTNPGFRKEAVTLFHGNLDSAYQFFDGTAEGIQQSQTAAFLHGGDSRFGMPERAILESRTLEEAKAWIEPELKNGYLEITIVGEFDQADAVKMLAATFGSLPLRAAGKPTFAAERIVNFPAGGIKEFTFPSEIPKAQVQLSWPTIDASDIKKTRRLNALGIVLKNRVLEKVREELGDAYSPWAANESSPTWTNYGSLSAFVEIDPSKSEAVTKVVAEIAKELSQGDAISQDELDRALKPVLVSFEELRRTNAYWLNIVLQTSQEYPKVLESARDLMSDFQAISVAEVNTLAKEFLREDKLVTIIIKPASATTTASQSPNEGWKWSIPTNEETSKIENRTGDTTTATPVTETVATATSVSTPITTATPVSDPIADLVRFIQENAILNKNASDSKAN